MFDRATYWKNRKEGRRGQGPVVLAHHTVRGLSKGWNRAFGRKEQNRKDRTFTTKGYRFGIHMLYGKLSRVEHQERSIARVQRKERGEQERVGKRGSQSLKRVIKFGAK